MASPKTKKPRAKQVDVEAFLSRYFALNENSAALARELGIKPHAVTMRLTRIGRDKVALAKAAGLAAGVLQESLVPEQEAPPPTTSDIISAAGFQQGMADTNNRFRILDRLDRYGQNTDFILQHLTKEIEDHLSSKAGTKMKPYYIDMFCKLVREGRSLAEVTHRIRKDILAIRGQMAFFEAVARILEKQIPDVQDQLYAELSRLGAYGQAELLSQTADTEIEICSEGV